MVDVMFLAHNGRVGLADFTSQELQGAGNPTHPDPAEYGPARFHSDSNALYERHLLFDYAIDPDLATPRERYQAVALSLRDVLPLRWLRTKKTHYRVDPKRSFQIRGGSLVTVPNKPSTLLGIPFDRPMVGYGGRTINTLRLWAAGAPDSFHFHQFGHGDFVGAVTETLAAESITRVLYPEDTTGMGRELRFLQVHRGIEQQPPATILTLEVCGGGRLRVALTIL
jgi:glucan phosphorylase